MAWVFVFVVNNRRPDVLESTAGRGRNLRAKIYVILLAARNGEYKMADDPKNSDIQDVMREEKSRGKRRVDMEALHRRDDLLKKFREALTLRTEREFVDAIREMKLADDPVKLRELLKIWRASS